MSNKVVAVATIEVEVDQSVDAAVASSNLLDWLERILPIFLKDGRRKGATVKANGLAAGAKDALAALTANERVEIFQQFCVYCGDDDPSCQCWNDE